MKAYLALISAAALALSACGDQGKPAEPAASTPPAAASAEPSASQSSEVPPSETPASPASTAASDTAATTAAGACEAVVESDDAMNFNTKELVIDKTNCKEFKVTLKHTGKMPKTAMGHNIVISKAEDTKAVLFFQTACLVQAVFPFATPCCTAGLALYCPIYTNHTGRLKPIDDFSDGLPKRGCNEFI